MQIACLVNYRVESNSGLALCELSLGNQRSIDGRPFSALDAISRKQLQELTKALHKEFGMTTIFVTHDTDEALKLGDRIAVLQDGEIRQVAEPETILQAPATDFVANLFGGSLHV